MMSDLLRGGMPQDKSNADASQAKYEHALVGGEVQDGWKGFSPLRQQHNSAGNQLFCFVSCLIKSSCLQKPCPTTCGYARSQT
jgi:hypothetical protein